VISDQLPVISYQLSVITDQLPVTSYHWSDVSFWSVPMKKFSPPEMKEVSFPTPHTLHPTPSFKSGIRRNSDHLYWIFQDALLSEGYWVALTVLSFHCLLFTQQFSFQKVTIYTDRKRDLTGGKIAIANQCWTGVISAIQSLWGLWHFWWGC
jgi:hypothetical protein